MTPGEEIRELRRELRQMQEWFAMVLLSVGGQVEIPRRLMVKFNPRDYAIVRWDDVGRTMTRFAARKVEPLLPALDDGPHAITPAEERALHARGLGSESSGESIRAALREIRTEEPRR